jgi:hypothetical protein
MQRLSSRYRKSPDIVSRRIADEVILVPIRRNVADLQSIYTLNEAASRIWQLIGPENSLDKIKKTMVKEFEVTSQEAEEDIVEFVRQMEEIKAIKAL